MTLKAKLDMDIKKEENYQQTILMNIDMRILNLITVLVTLFLVKTKYPTQNAKGREVYFGSLCVEVSVCNQRAPRQGGKTERNYRGETAHAGRSRRWQAQSKEATSKEATTLFLFLIFYPGHLPLGQVTFAARTVNIQRIMPNLFVD